MAVYPIQLEANLTPIEELQPKKTKVALSPFHSIDKACFGNLQSFSPTNFKDYQTVLNLKKQRNPYKTFLKRQGKQSR